MNTPAPQTIYLRDYRPPDYLVNSVYLDFHLHPTATRVRSRLEIRPNPEAEGKDRPLILDGEELELDEIRLNGEKLGADAYEVTAQSLTLEKVPAEAFTLEITTYCNPEANQALSGLYQLPRYLSARSARRKASAASPISRTGRISCRSIQPVSRPTVSLPPYLLSNGNRCQARVRPLRPMGTHYAVWEDPHPKPSYLFALVGGDLTCVDGSASRRPRVAT